MSNDQTTRPAGEHIHNTVDVVALKERIAELEAALRPIARAVSFDKGDSVTLIAILTREFEDARKAMQK